MSRKKVIVSPDMLPIAPGAASEHVDRVSVSSGPSGERVILISMAEWKQVLVRATRATIPAFLVLAGGGSAAEAATGAGVPPLMMVGLPSTGIFLVDTIGICFLIFLLWAAWNAVEFWFDLDETNPGVRA